MKHTKEVVVPEIVTQVTEYVTCDICSEKIVAAMYHPDDVRISRHNGESYPEGGWGTDVEFDICGKCFESRLVPWLAEQGASPREEEWEW
jgi:hypothetical protein